MKGSCRQPVSRFGVRHGGYRTMAFRDEDGVWWTLAKKEELKGAVEVIESDLQKGTRSSSAC